MYKVVGSTAVDLGYLSLVYSELNVYSQSHLCSFVPYSRYNKLPVST